MGYKPGEGLDDTWTDAEKKQFEPNLDAWQDNGCLGSGDTNVEFPCGCKASVAEARAASIPFLFMAAALAAAVGSF